MCFETLAVEEYEEARQQEERSAELQKAVDLATQSYNHEVKRDEDALRRLGDMLKNVDAEYQQQRSEHKAAQEKLREQKLLIEDMNYDLQTNKNLLALSEGLNMENVDEYPRQWKSQITRLKTVVERIQSYLKTLPVQFSRASDKACEEAKHRVLGILSASKGGNANKAEAEESQ